jgi:hypothetical protein
VTKITDRITSEEKFIFPLLKWKKVEPMVISLMQNTWGWECVKVNTKPHGGQEAKKEDGTGELV